MSPAVNRAAGTPNTTSGCPPFRNARASSSLCDERWSWIHVSTLRSAALTVPIAAAAMATCHQRMEGGLEGEGRWAGALVGSTTTQARTIRSLVRRSGGRCAFGRLDVDRDADLITHDLCAFHEPVQRNAIILTLDAGGGGKGGSPATRRGEHPSDFGIEHDRVRDAPDRQIAGDAQAIGRDALHARASERDLGKAVGGEIVRTQIVIAPVIAGRDTGRLDVRGDARGVRLVGIVVQVGGPLPERAEIGRA